MPVALPEADHLVELDVGPVDVIHRFRIERGLRGCSSPLRPRLLARVVKATDAGIGVELAEIDGGRLTEGDVVSLRHARGCALELCMAVRAVPGPAAGTTWIGLRRLSRRAHALDTAGPRAGHEASCHLLFVPGEDQVGHDDTCLVNVETFARGTPVEAYLGRCPYSFHFTRVRESGRGWVMASFEIQATLEA